MKNNLIKIVAILIICVMVSLFSTTVFADNNSTLDDLTSTLKNNTSNSNSNTNTNTNLNTNMNTNTNTNTNNTSIYNNTDLPKTGIEDSIPIAMLVVVFGISAGYAYKKIKDYDNI